MRGAIRCITGSISNWKATLFSRQANLDVDQSLTEKSLLDRRSLYKLMLSAYNLAELKILCSNLNVRFGDLAEEPLTVRIHRLIEYCRRHSKYGQLVHQVLQERSHLAEESL
jgi:hypothetical protein